MNGNAPPLLMVVPYIPVWRWILIYNLRECNFLAVGIPIAFLVLNLSVCDLLF